MAIRESLLDALSSIATSDFVRSVTAAGASSKVTVSNLAKTIIENYTGSTLAGSSQSVKSAIDALDSAVDAIADYIVEQGTSGIWTYRKWNSGIAECWGSVYEVKDCTSAWGSVYDSGAATSQNFPSGLFASAPTLTVTAVGHSTATLQLETSGATLTTRTFSYYYTMPYSAAGIQATVNFHALGRWK